MKREPYLYMKIYRKEHLVVRNIEVKEWSIGRDSSDVFGVIASFDILVSSDVDVGIFTDQTIFVSTKTSIQQPSSDPWRQDTREVELNFTVGVDVESLSQINQGLDRSNIGRRNSAKVKVNDTQQRSVVMFVDFLGCLVLDEGKLASISKDQDHSKV